MPTNPIEKKMTVVIRTIAFMVLLPDMLPDYSSPGKTRQTEEFRHR